MGITITDTINFHNLLTKSSNGMIMKSLKAFVNPVLCSDGS